MKNIFKAFLITIFFGACTSTPEKKEAFLVSGLYPTNMDTTVRPGDNFQMYVNGKWMKETEIPADKSNYGNFTKLNEKSQENVKVIIEESASGNFEYGTDEQKVGDLYASYMDMETRNAKGIEPLVSEFGKIDALTKKEELASYFANAGKYGINTPINLFIYPNMKDPTQYALYNWQGGLGLPDREYYFTNDEKSVQIRNEYLAHINKMFELAGLENEKGIGKTILEIETSIASKHWKKEDTRDMLAMFNYYRVDSLNDVMTNFNWKLYLKGTGVPNLEKIVITQPSYTIALNDLIDQTDLDIWKDYLKWKVINGYASRLNAALDEQNFKFFGTMLRGTPEQLPMWRRGVKIVNENLGEVVGKVYVTKHFPPEAKKRMEELVGNLISAYEESISQLDWMGMETREQALDKLSKFTAKIGYPDKWKNYSAVEIHADDLFGNLKSASLAEHNRELAKLGGPIDKTEWGMTPQTVNAYYNPAMNEIVFPAAILQPPFFDMTADDAVNYGAIGAVIGHEIGHGFDDQGSTFDGDGALRNWWTDSDREEFEKRTHTLVSQYNEFKVFDDLNVNGEFTLGENIGDLGGLTIALKAYQMSLGGEAAPVMEGFTGIQRVFMGWGQAWLKKSREEALRMQVGTNPHSPAKFRVNGVVRNIPEFYEAFGVQESDSLYLAPKERVKIW